MNWIVFLIALVVIGGWFAWTYISVRRAAKFIDNAEFESMIHTSQLIDVREAAAFKTKHIIFIVFLLYIIIYYIYDIIYHISN